MRGFYGLTGAFDSQALRSTLQNKTYEILLQALLFMQIFYVR